MKSITEFEHEKKDADEILGLVSGSAQELQQLEKNFSKSLSQKRAFDFSAMQHTIDHHLINSTTFRLLRGGEMNGHEQATPYVCNQKSRRAS